MTDLMLRLGEEQVLALALVLLSGYLLGKIRFFGISFGGAGILLSALIFGHFGLELDGTIQDLGLACFVTAVGLSAGPDLFQNLKRGFKSYMLLALAIVGTGVLLCMGSVKMDVPKATLDVLKEAGMILFLAVAGTEAGAGFLDIVKEQGIRLFFIGGLMTLLPMLVGYFLARRLLSMPLRNSLGAICGGMTSTPALGSLLSVTDSNDVVVSYVATYPIALLAMVLFSHGLIGILP